jgi:hypothetical protein
MIPNIVSNFMTRDANGKTEAGFAGQCDRCLREVVWGLKTDRLDLVKLVARRPKVIAPTWMCAPFGSSNSPEQDRYALLKSESRSPAPLAAAACVQ